MRLISAIKWWAITTFYKTRNRVWRLLISLGLMSKGEPAKWHKVRINRKDYYIPVWNIKGDQQ